MGFGCVLKSYAAVATISLAAMGVAPGSAVAQEALTLSKYSAGATGDTPNTPLSIALGADGNMWFTGTGTNPQIYVLRSDGSVVTFADGFANGTVPVTLIPGPDGRMWFTDTGNNGIGTITTDGVISQVVSKNASTPNSAAFGADNHLWYTESSGTEIIRMSLDGGIQSFTAGISASAGIQMITLGPDGNMWFTEATANRIGSITPTGRITEFGAGITPGAGLYGIATGSDGNIWFTESNTGKIGRITTSGQVTEFTTGIKPSQGPFPMIAGPDGNLWFAERNGGLNGNEGKNRIGRITTSGTVTEFLTDTPGLYFPGYPQNLAVGANGSIWFTQPLDNYVSSYSLSSPSVLSASVLPGGRTVVPGTLATVFATMANGGSTALSNCSVELPSGSPVGLQFSYQTTNSSTNQLTGTLNTPFSLAANGGTQSLLLTFQSDSDMFLPGFPLYYNCGQPGSKTGAAVVGGLNTVDLNFSALSSPDDLALAATTTPGVVSMPLYGDAAFAVSMTNIGYYTPGSPLTSVSVDTGLSVLPLTVTICRTDPATSVCLDTPKQQQFYSFPAGQTSTFAVFVTSTGPVTFDPTNNRVYVRFIDPSGTFDEAISRGTTSVAVQTQ
jgi:virginiamycin B lyase